MSEANVKAKSSFWKTLGIIIVTFATLIFVAAYGYGYFQLSRINMTLADSVAGLQQQLNHTQTAVVTLQKSIENMQLHAAEKSQESPELKQDRIATELYLRLLAVDHQLDDLPLLTAPTAIQASTTPSANEPKTAWAHAYALLQKVMVVRYVGNDTLPFILPEQKTYLYQNLHAEMQAAIWGVLHHHQPVYQASLLRVIAWIQRYFVQDAALTRNVLQALQALEKANIN